MTPTFDFFIVNVLSWPVVVALFRRCALRLLCCVVLVCVFAVCHCCCTPKVWFQQVSVFEICCVLLLLLRLLLFVFACQFAMPRFFSAWQTAMVKFHGAQLFGNKVLSNHDFWFGEIRRNDFKYALLSYMELLISHEFWSA